MSVPRDMARHTDPELDELEVPTTKIRRLASHSDLGEPHPGAGDPALAEVTGSGLPVMRPSFRPTAHSHWPLPAGLNYSAGRPVRTLQRRDVAYLLGSLGLVIALVLVATAVVLGPVLSLFSHTSPGPPVAAGPPIATSPPAATSPTTSATFVELDNSTQGNWQGVYGSAGYIVAGDTTQQLPASIQVTSTGATPYTWATSTADVRALLRPGYPTRRVAGTWYSPTSFTFDITITDGHPHQLALYVLNWGHWNLAETVSVVDASSGRLLDTRRVIDFDTGEYLVWQVSGHITLRVTNNAARPNNAIASGLFFAPAAHP